MHPNDATEELPMQDMASIISPATSTAIRNITKPKMALSLWQTKKFLGLGTPGKYIM